MKPIRYSATFDDVWLVEGARTPFVDYCGAFADLTPTDMGIKAARGALERAGIPATEVQSVITANMAPGDFHAYMLPRHVGLYAGVPVEVPAMNVQRICGSGFEIIRQAGDDISRGYAEVVLACGSESMTRNPIAAFGHRTGFKLGAPVEFKDYLWEALDDPAPDVSMIQTAENLARKYGITRAEVDEFAAMSFERAVAAQEAGRLAEEIVPVVNETFELEGYNPRRIRLPRKVEEVSADTHPRPSPLEALARLRSVYPDGVQTAGNSSALVDGAAATVIAKGSALSSSQPRLARLVAAAVAGVPPEIMGIGPAPAIRAVLERAGLTLDDIAIVEINEAQGAQIVACERELELDRSKLNVNGGAIALGHPLAATGMRLTLSAARELRRRGARYAVASACIGGGQGMALLIENPNA